VFCGKGEIIYAMFQGKISELKLLKHVISLKITCFPKIEDREPLINTLKEIRLNSEKRFVRINMTSENRELKFSGVFTIRSLNIQKNIIIVVHIAKKTLRGPYLHSAINTLARLAVERRIHMEIQPAVIRNGQSDSYQVKVDKTELEPLVQKASILTGKSPEQIIQEATSFTGKDGEFVQGKTSIEALTEKQKVVLRDKLIRITSKTSQKS